MTDSGAAIRQARGMADRRRRAAQGLAARKIEVGGRHDAYRDGRVHVRAELCSSCIFRSGNLMHLCSGQVRGMVDEAREADAAIICHQTLDGPNAVCRGFYDRHPTRPLRLAGRLGLVEWS